MRLRRRHVQTLGEAEINLTPLIDVCFVVLIMFIIVAPILEMERIELAAGPPVDQKNIFAVQEKSAIVIHVYADDTIAMNQKKIPLNHLTTLLAHEKKKSPQCRPQIFQDSHAKFGTYQAVKNAVEAAGFSEMDLILRPQ